MVTLAIVRVHIFKLKSRLGIPNIPYGGTELNIGVEDAPDYILTQNFFDSLDVDITLDSFTFSKPEEIDTDDYWNVLARELKKASEFIEEQTEGRETQIVVGGDQSVSFSSLVARLKQVQNPNDLGYMHIDSHGDCNTIASSPSGNFHGMYLRPFLDGFDNEAIQSLVPLRLPIKNVFYIGNLELDPEEIPFFEKNNIRRIGSSNLIQADQELRNFINSFPYLHISLDIDVFSKDFVTATGTPAKNGIDKKYMLELLGYVLRHPNVSLDLVEVNPKKEGGKTTVALAQEILQEFVKSRYLNR